MGLPDWLVANLGPGSSIPSRVTVLHGSPVLWQFRCCSCTRCRVFPVQHLGRPGWQAHQLPGSGDTSTDDCGGGLVRRALHARSPQCGCFAIAVCCCEVAVLHRHAVLCCALVKLQLFRLWFSHPAVKGIIMWGWWDGNIWISNAGIYRADKTPKQAALAIRELWDNELSTRLHVEQPQTGVSAWTPFKGFFGVYRYSYTTVDGSVVQGTVQLGRDQPRQNLDAGCLTGAEC